MPPPPSSASLPLPPDLHPTNCIGSRRAVVIGQPAQRLGDRPIVQPTTACLVNQLSKWRRFCHVKCYSSLVFLPAFPLRPVAVLRSVTRGFSTGCRSSCSELIKFIVLGICTLKEHQSFSTRYFLNPLHPNIFCMNPSESHDSQESYAIPRNLFPSVLPFRPLRQHHHPPVVAFVAQPNQQMPVSAHAMCPHEPFVVESQKNKVVAPRYGVHTGWKSEVLLLQRIWHSASSLSLHLTLPICGVLPFSVDILP